MDGRQILAPLDCNSSYEPQKDQDRDDHLSLELSLAINCAPDPAPANPVALQPAFHLQPHSLFAPPQLPPTASIVEAGPSVRHHPPQPRVRSSGPRHGKSLTIAAPYPWATTRRAVIHNLEYLHRRRITEITGKLQCMKCEHIFVQKFNLKSKFTELATFVAENKGTMHDRAPKRWLNPILPMCPKCNQNNVKPYITKKRSINWLFMLLGEYLYCCKLAELKYFCKHTSNHRTGAKDRLVYITYIGLFKQLDPNVPF